MLVAPEPKVLGSTEPRIFTPPARPLTESTTLGFECIRFAEDVLGLELLPWQRWFLVHALELTTEGAFRFRIVLLLVGRQNGKSLIAQVIALWRMYVDGAKLVLGTAQNLDTAKEVWQDGYDLAESVPELAEAIAGVSREGGKRSFWLQGKERWAIATASRKGGRGMSSDLVIMDELREHTDWESWGAVTNTTLARKRAQVLCLSNAGDSSSVVLAEQRKKALTAIEEVWTRNAPGLFEWSAPDGCDIRDPNMWALSNPSMNYTSPEDGLQTALSAPEHVFRTENLCQWVNVAKEGPFGEGRWEACSDPESTIIGVPRLGLDVSHDRSYTWLGVAGWREDGTPGLEVILRRAGTEWVVPELPKIMEGLGVDTVVIQGRGAPASSLIPHLEAAGVEVTKCEGPGLGASSGLIFERVRDQTVRHRGQAALDQAATTALTKPIGGVWAFDRVKSPTDAAPLCAVTFALWGLIGQPEKTELVSAYAGDTVDHDHSEPWWR